MKQRILRTYLLSDKNLKDLAAIRARAQSSNESRISDSLIFRALITYASKLKIKELTNIINNELKDK